MFIFELAKVKFFTIWPSSKTFEKMSLYIEFRTGQITFSSKSLMQQKQYAIASTRNVST